VTLVAVLTLAVSGVALASEHDGEEEEAEVEASEELVDSWFWYDMELMTLVFALPDAETEETPECVPSEEPGEPAEVVAEEDPVALPEGCVVVDVVGPSGKVTHGSVVSSFVHALKEDYDKSAHGPMGQWVREIAQSDHGKKWAEAEAAGEDGEEATTAESRGNKKPKKPKKNR